MSCLFKCPYCKAAVKKRKVSGGPVACQVCLRIFEECHTEVQGLFVELLHDVPFSAVTPDLNNERRDTQKAALAPKDPTSRSSGFVTAFSTASLELSPLFTTTSSSISGHLAELERLLGDSLYSAGEGPCSPGTTDILRAYFQILEVASILALDRDRADHAVHLFRKCLAANSLRNRNVEALATACLVHAMREAQEPRTLQKVAAAAGLPQKEVGKHLKVLADVLKLSQPVNSNSIAVHLPRFCASLQLDKTTQDLAAHIGEVVISKSFCTRRNPISISAAAIYLSCQLEDKRKTQTEICKATGLTEVTLRKVYKELLENLDDLLPPNYRPPVPLERAFPVTAAALGRVTASRNTSTNPPLCSPEPHVAVPSHTGPLVAVPSQEAAQLPPLPRHWSSPPSSIPPTNRCANSELPEGVNRSAGKGIDAAAVVTPVPTFRSGEGSAFLARGQGPGVRNGRTFSGVGPPPCFTGGSRQQQSGEGDGPPSLRKGTELEREDRQRESHEAEEERWRARERDGVLKEQEAHGDRCRDSGAMHPSPTGTSGGATSFENSFFPYQGMGAPRMMDPRLAHAWAAANHQRMFGGFHPAVRSGPMSAAEANRQEVEARDVGEGGAAKGAADMGAGTGRAAAMAEGSGIQPASMASASRGLAPGEGMRPFSWMGLPPSGVGGTLQRDQERSRAGVRDRAAEIAGKEGGGAQPSEKLGQAGKSEALHAQSLGETPGHRQSQDNGMWGRFRSGQGSGPEAGAMPPGFVPAFQGFPPQFWQMVAGASGRFPMFPPPFLPPEFARSMAAGGGASTAKRDGAEDKGENAGRSDGSAARLGPRQTEAEGTGRSSTAWSPKDGRTSQVPQSPMMMPPMPFPQLFMPQASRLGLGDGPGLGDKGRPENGGQPENSRGCGNILGAGFHPMLSMMALQQMYGPHMAAMARPSPLREGPRVAEVGGESNGAVEHKAPP